MLSRVAIIGRPNVGKSSLFNRMIGSKKSIVEDKSGVTRDRLYEKVVYNEQEFVLIDTGGITQENGDFVEDIELQAKIAIDESDIILFIVDGRVGITKDDEHITKLLRRIKKKVVVVVNKVDNKEFLDKFYEFYKFGFDNVVAVSAVHGNGVYNILDFIVNNAKMDNEKEFLGISFSIIGRPNVGKSSLFNAIIKENKSIVSDIEGTTRDGVDTYFKINEKEYKMVDTAGIRKRGKVYENIEKYSVLRALKVIEKSDIILWMIDADRGVVEQDKRVLGYAFEEKKPIIVIVNKWDLITKTTNTQKNFKINLQEKMPFIKNFKMIFLSALTTKGLKSVIPAIDLVYKEYSTEVSTAKVNKILNEAVMRKTHPTHKGKPIRFYYGTQISTKPPKFVIFVNNKKLIHFSYERYLANYFKYSLCLEQINIIFTFKNRSEE